MATKREDIHFEEFRKLLTEERNRLVGEHQKSQEGMAEESAESRADSGRERGDAATQITDRETDEALDANTRYQIRRIDEALERIDNGTYGICVVTGEPIPVARLRALPWADKTVEAAERTE